jgi:ribosomal protein S18 acetylase RimI-like enzyme
MTIEVEVLRDVTDADMPAINRLLAQLSRSAPPLDAAAVRQIATWDGNSLLVARADGQIVGMATLVTFPIPTGLRAWIEDVVVDESARGQGIGAVLSREAVRLARAAGARTIDLTSRPSREAANRLYQRLGFQLRDSSVYRMAGEEPGLSGGQRDLQVRGDEPSGRVAGKPGTGDADRGHAPGAEQHTERVRHLSGVRATRGRVAQGR